MPYDSETIYTYAYTCARNNRFAEVIKLPRTKLLINLKNSLKFRFFSLFCMLEQNCSPCTLTKHSRLSTVMYCLQDSENIKLTPTLKCSPSYKFQGAVTITLPTCYMPDKAAVEMTVSEHKYFTKWFNASAYSCLICCCTSCRLELSDPKALIHFSSSSGFSLQISGPPHASFTMDLLISSQQPVCEFASVIMYSVHTQTGQHIFCPKQKFYNQEMGNWLV